MKAVFCDLDNTLYDNRQYFLGAFKEISIYLSKKYNVPWQKIYKNLVNLWREKTSCYPYLFNDLLSILNIKNTRLMKKIIDIFNEYRGSLKPYRDVIPTLKELRERGYKLGIITDGNIKRQKRKIKYLGINRFFGIVIYTKKIKPKPSEKPFLVALKRLKIKPERVLYVGDNPLIDFRGAKRVGIRTVRILKGEFQQDPKNKYIDFEIKSLKELLRLRKK